MSMDKRTFLKQGAALAAGFPVLTTMVHDLNQRYHGITPESLAKSEDYWQTIRQAYRLKQDYINLENGYYNFIPEPTLNKYIDHIREVNYQGSYYMRTVQFENKDKAAHKLADLLDCGHDELIVTRNTTESMDTVVNGYDWRAGDEAVMAEQDYGSMLNQFKLIADRYGVKNTMISVPNHPVSDNEIVDLYEKAITPKTRLLMVCHMINITGHILPIRKIAEMAHGYNVDVMVDGAHAVGHFDFSLRNLGCDYYGSSLHKWLSTPLGAGMLYVRKEKIKGLWPTFASWNNNPEDIRKLNQTGTHPVHTDLTIQDAIEFYLAIGKERKEARLRFLQQYWTSKLRNIEGVILNTPADAQRSCGIANIGVSNMKPSELSKILMDKYKIFTVPIEGQGVFGCRITPNIYTTTDELDVFVEAIKEVVA
jgi:selenocysteine lyase/cysteine desulfurase